MSQITSVSIVCSIVCTGAYQSKHQSSASLAFARGIHRYPVDSPHKGPATRKMFPFDDVIMSYSASDPYLGLYELIIYECYALVLTIHFKNTLHPEWCVATVCHQVRCMYWGHLCLFHRGISDLDFIQNGLDGIFNFHVYLDEPTNMFSVYLQYGIEDLLWF